MKKAPLIACCALLGICVSGAWSQTATYVGAQKCMPCHKAEARGKQYPIWEASKHSKSFAALSSAQAATAAQALGVKDATADPKCLRCHAALFDKAADLKAEGVTCEICHGPGSDYKSLTVMKDKAEAVKKGLKLYADAGAVKAHCLTCHENAHGKSFDFAAAWEKIKHGVPGK